MAGGPGPARKGPNRGLIVGVSIGTFLLLALVITVAVLAGSRPTSKFSSVGSPIGGDAAPANEPPRANLDHWHIAYGVYVCDHFLTPFTDRGPDQMGIHTHGDGIIHVHPFSRYASGRNATLEVFAQQVGMNLYPGTVNLPSGKTYTDGSTCGSQPSRWVLYEWDVDHPDDAPIVHTDNFDAVRFTGDRRAMTLAFVPEGAEVPKPTTIPQLDQLSDTSGSNWPADTKKKGTTTTTKPSRPTPTDPPGFTERSQALAPLLADPPAWYEAAVVNGGPSAGDVITLSQLQQDTNITDLDVMGVNAAYGRIWVEPQPSATSSPGGSSGQRGLVVEVLQFDDEMSATHFEEVWATAADTAGGGAQVTAVPEIDGHRARVDDRTFIVGRKGNHAFFILGNGGGAVDADANALAKAQHDKLP